MTEIGYCLDWLRWSTSDYDTPARFRDMFSSFITDKTAKSPIPLPHYTKTEACDVIRFDWNETDPRMKCLCTMTGANLRTWGRAGGSIKALLFFAMACKDVTVTRLDFAVDLRGDANIEAQDIALLLDQNIARCRAGNWTVINSMSETGRAGCTVYVGARASRRFLRVYDKAAQTDSLDPWVRIELETKKPFANQVALAMLQNDIVDSGCCAIRDFIHSGAPWFDNAVLVHTGNLIDPVPKRETNHDAWVLAVALPAVLVACNQDLPGVRDAVRLCLRIIDRANDPADLSDLD